MKGKISKTSLDKLEEFARDWAYVDYACDRLGPGDANAAEKHLAKSKAAIIKRIVFLENKIKALTK